MKEYYCVHPCNVENLIRKCCDKPFCMSSTYVCHTCHYRTRLVFIRVLSPSYSLPVCSVDLRPLARVTHILRLTEPSCAQSSHKCASPWILMCTVVAHVLQARSTYVFTPCLPSVIILNFSGFCHWVIQFSTVSPI